MVKILLSRHWSLQVARTVIIVSIAWWLLGSPNLLAQFGLVEEWPSTDFDKHSVPLSEIISGGPGKDGIPAIDKPEFLRAGDDIDLSLIHISEPTRQPATSRMPSSA